MAFGPAGTALVTTAAGESRDVVVWDVPAGKPGLRIKAENYGRAPVAVSPDGTRLAVGTPDRGPAVFDLRTGRQVWRLDRRPGYNRVVFSPDGKTLAVAAGRVLLLDAATGRPLPHSGDWAAEVDPIRDRGRPLPAFGFAGDGRRVWAAAGGDRVTWDAATGREVDRGPADTGGAFRAADGRTAGRFERVAGTDRWEAVVSADGREVCRPPMTNSGRYLRPGPFSPDGRLLYAAGGGRAEVWDAATGRPVKTLADVTTPNGFLAAAVEVVPSPGGRYVAVLADTEFRKSSGCGTCDAFDPNDRAKSAAVWDAPTWAVVRTVPVPRGSWLRWLSDGAFVVEAVDRRLDNPRGRVVRSDDPDNSPPRVAPAALERAWADLAADDAGAAFRAARLLAAFPADAVPVLRAGVAAVKRASADRVKALVAALDAASFADRGAASAELAAVADEVEPVLREATGSASAEVRGRAGRLLAGVGRPSGEWLRLIRAVEAVEWMGTADAKGLLGEWAASADGRLAGDATVTLTRVGGK